MAPQAVDVPLSRALNPGAAQSGNPVHVPRIQLAVRRAPLASVFVGNQPQILRGTGRRARSAAAAACLSDHASFPVFLPVGANSIRSITLDLMRADVLLSLRF